MSVIGAELFGRPTDAKVNGPWLVLVSVMVSDVDVTPVPLSATVRLPPGFALMVSEADLLPVDAGVNFTTMLQLPPAAMGIVQPLETSGKDAASVPVIATTG